MEYNQAKEDAIRLCCPVRTLRDQLEAIGCRDVFISDMPPLPFARPGMSRWRVSWRPVKQVGAVSVVKKYVGTSGEIVGSFDVYASDDGNRVVTKRAVEFTYNQDVIAWARTA